MPRRRQIIQTSETIGQRQRRQAMRRNRRDGDMRFFDFFPVDIQFRHQTFILRAWPIEIGKPFGRIDSDLAGYRDRRIERPFLLRDRHQANLPLERLSACRQIDVDRDEASRLRLTRLPAEADRALQRLRRDALGIFPRILRFLGAK